jgi:hypothetical protein
LPRWSLLALQRLQVQRPFFSFLTTEITSKRMTYPSRRPVLRVWLPFRRTLSARWPLGSIFQPPTLMGFTLQSFIPARWLQSISRLHSALALFCITSSALHRRFSDLYHPASCIPYLLPDGLDQVGTYCSPGFYTFQVFSPNTPQKKHLPSSVSLSFFQYKSLTAPIPLNLRDSSCIQRSVSLQ